MIFLLIAGDPVHGRDALGHLRSGEPLGEDDLEDGRRHGDHRLRLRGTAVADASEREQDEPDGEAEPNREHDERNRAPSHDAPTRRPPSIARRRLSQRDALLDHVR